MKPSRRVQRMERHHKRNKNNVGLNIVALMDIFTLLVFFLLVNVSSDVTLPSAKSIKLPESVAENKPKETLILIVSDKDIVLGGRKVAEVASVINSKTDLIVALKDELELQARMLVKKTNPDGTPVNGEITIMGDKEIPYRLLKKIMVTCTQAQYGNIKLAVTQKGDTKGKG